ncbi:MADF domain-containing protein [Caenorhabditis elegans]|uniref:MADF domain-containing protein n=1 Tax=Caenorhabditis elegans TaxID=6239 RepID=Q6BER4_CAEEL|nr:MADF domain-containing protein [Caenorhabditis elegans]CAH04749.1 MADF domain-containing protein [Caenorhabditis elegans]|eukprot:NP_001021453.1 Uncharacterized protein CELE_F36D1.9 [Caenorhabditis elegans]
MPTKWTESAEATLVELTSKSRPLWTVRAKKDFGDNEMIEMFRIREGLNSKTSSAFTVEMIMEKWLEIRLLFDLKYAMNGYTLEDRGHHIRRDGSLKDDLNESWKLFKKLDFLVDPSAGEKKVFK